MDEGWWLNTPALIILIIRSILIGEEESKSGFFWRIALGTRWKVLEVKEIIKITKERKKIKKETPKSFGYLKRWWFIGIFGQSTSLRNIKIVNPIIFKK